MKPTVCLLSAILCVKLSLIVKFVFVLNFRLFLEMQQYKCYGVLDKAKKKKSCLIVHVRPTVKSLPAEKGFFFFFFFFKVIKIIHFVINMG